MYYLYLKYTVLTTLTHFQLHAQHNIVINSHIEYSKQAKCTSESVSLCFDSQIHGQFDKLIL